MRAVIRFGRATALRWTILSASLVAAVALPTFAGAAQANPKVPLPKARPIARTVVPKITVAAKPASPPLSLDAAIVAPTIQPATRQHAALPPPAARKPAPVPVLAATSSTSQADTDALEKVIELVRARKPADATQVKASISDAVAQKLAEWIILRSDNNGASVERYRAFIEANPSWPSQTFLRRRLEAALWDDRRDDSVVLSWFQNEKP